MVQKHGFHLHKKGVTIIILT